MGDGLQRTANGYGRYQNSTSRPGTRENSSQLRVASPIEPTRAIDAIVRSSTSIGPLGAAAS